MFHCQYLHRRMTKNQGTHIQPNNIRYGNRRNRNRNHCRRNRGSGRFRSKCCNENCPRNKRFLRSIASFRRSHNNPHMGRIFCRIQIFELIRSNRKQSRFRRRIRRSCSRSRGFPCACIWFRNSLSSSRREHSPELLPAHRYSHIRNKGRICIFCNWRQRNKLPPRPCRKRRKFRQSRLLCRRGDGLRHILQNRRSYMDIVRKDKRGGNMK